MRPDKGQNEDLGGLGRRRRGQDVRRRRRVGGHEAPVRRRRVSGVWPQGGVYVVSLWLSRSAVPGASKIRSEFVDG